MNVYEAFAKVDKLNEIVEVLRVSQSLLLDPKQIQVLETTIEEHQKEIDELENMLKNTQLNTQKNNVYRESDIFGN